ncbi:hypothetical protein [Corallococcus sp. EGB]|uniref:hypothetical protein n=1 Tax=Corallococcus sp. EGB TaxID=1521117 RepID=UPI001CBCCE10|nr:hypothetical protein [Corallococcus sp. EGB]
MKRRLRKLPPGDPRAFGQALLSVIGAVHLVPEPPDVSPLLRHARDYMDAHPECDWKQGLPHKPERGALLLALAVVSPELLRAVEPTSLCMLGVAGEA